VIQNQRKMLWMLNIKIILYFFKSEVVNQKILTNQYLSEDICRFTKIYQSPNNILTKVDDKRLIVKKTPQK